MFVQIPYSRKRLALQVSAIALGTLVLAACGGDSKPADNTGFSMEAVPAPDSDFAKREVVASPSAEVDGEQVDIQFHTLLRSGDAPDGDPVFGQLVDQTGAAIYEGASPAISDSNEHTSLLPIGDRLFSVSQFENNPGAMFLIELDQNRENGLLAPKALWQIDQTSVHGGWTHCAATVTPWNTHLASEEYEVNARNLNTSTGEIPSSYYDDMARYFGGDYLSMNPYWWGWNIEVKVDAVGDNDPTTTLTKHYAMGRLAFELSYVMPDKKTVYMSDDGTNVGLFMFVADTAGDLSAGNLYAAKWNQTSSAGLGAADLGWVDLGHATDAEIAAHLALSGTGRVNFADIFDAVDPVGASDASDPATICPATYTPVKAGDVGPSSEKVECLKVKSGMEQVASRLETRRYAALMGATTEFRKEEGITFDPASKRLFISMSEVERGMENFAKDGSASLKYDLSSANHIQLDDYNLCGGVYQLALGTDAAIGSDYVAQTMQGLVAGIPASYPGTSPYATYTCDKDGIANPDNLTFIKGRNKLIIGEDTGSGHQNDAIWLLDLAAVDSANPKAGLTRILTTPYGSETTGPYWYPDINGFAYLMTVVQHPYGESDSDKLAPGSLDHRAYTGYVGPFPAVK